MPTPIVDHGASRGLTEVSDISGIAEFPLGDAGRNIPGVVMTVDASATA